MKKRNKQINELLEKLDYDVKIRQEALIVLEELETVPNLNQMLKLRLIHEYLNHFPRLENNLNQTEEMFFYYKALDKLRFENMMERKVKWYREKTALEEKLDKDDYKLEILQTLEDKVSASSLLERENQQVKLNHLINKQLNNRRKAN